MRSEDGTKTGRMQVWKALRIDLIPFRFTLEHMSAAIAKLKNGKGSPDGCTPRPYLVKHLCSFVTFSRICLYHLFSLSAGLLWARLLFQRLWGHHHYRSSGRSHVFQLPGSSADTSGCNCFLRCSSFLSNVASFLVHTQPTACTLSNGRQSSAASGWCLYLRRNWT